MFLSMNMINKLLNNENVSNYSFNGDTLVYFENKIIEATSAEIIKRFAVKLYLDNINEVYLLASDNKYQDLGFKLSEKINNEYDLLKKNTRDFVLGHSFKVIVDKPVLTTHSYLPDTVYEINGGFIDFEENFQEAYIAGVYEAVESFKGYVVAVISYKDKDYKKWIINKDLIYDKQEIINDLGHLEENNLIEIEWL